MTENFKNITKSVACRHQRHMCYVLSNPSVFLKDIIESGPGVSSAVLT